MTPKAYLEEFAKTNCSPLFIVPCMVSTRLEIMMDVGKAKKNYPEYMKACGYDTFLSQGERDFQIYPPDPKWMASFTATPHLIKGCIEKLMTPQMELVDGEAIYYKKDGLKMKPQYEGEYSLLFGNDNKEKCGWRALNNILSGPGLTNGFPYLVNWQEDLVYLGYRNNLSMQLIPYDWRLDTRYIVKHFEFRAAVEHLYAMTGKKIMISTHSYGINVGYQGMLLFNEEERQKYFKGFVSIGGPWLGAGDPLSYLVGMNGADFGFAHISLDGMMGNLPVLYSLTPKDTYERFKNEDWIKKTLELKDYYEHKLTKKPYSFMPDAKDLCSLEDYTDNNYVGNDFVHQCKVGLVNYDILAKVGDRTWKISEAEEFLKKYGVGAKPVEYYKAFNNHKESAFPNMNIPTYIFLSNNISTPYYNHYDELTKETEGRTLSQPKSSIKMAGDGTVPLISQLGPGTKWALEFEAKKPNTKPIKFVHYCNALHNRNNNKYKELFSETDWVKELQDETKNSYLDLDCECSDWKIVGTGETLGDKIHMICGHVGAFQDRSVRNFVFHLLKGGEKTNGLTDFVKSADDAYLNKLDEHCTIEKPSFLHNWKQNYTKKNEMFFQKKGSKTSFWRRRMNKSILKRKMAQY